MGFFGTLPSVFDLGLIWGIAAIGVFITFRILDFADLTVDGSFATGGCVFAVLSLAGVPLPISLIVAFIAGMLAGLITALLHCYLGIPGILAGILTQLMLYSINLKILGQAYRSISNRGSLIGMSANSASAIPPVITTLLIVFGIAAVVIAFLYWFFGTRFGSSIRATGSNESMAKANGININSRKIVALMLSNGLVAFAGAILTQFQGSVDVNMGRGAIVIALAAIIIGTTIGAKFVKNFAVSLTFVLVGAIIYFFVYQLVVFYTNEPELLKMISAIVVAIFLAFPYIKNTYIKNFKAKRQRAKELQ